ncbi:MAG: HD domain-containing phosphohydrolase [Bacillota bacterium]
MQRIRNGRLFFCHMVALMIAAAYLIIGGIYRGHGLPDPTSSYVRIGFSLTYLFYVGLSYGSSLIRRYSYILLILLSYVSLFHQAWQIYSGGFAINQYMVFMVLFIGANLLYNIKNRLVLAGDAVVIGFLIIASSLVDITPGNMFLHIFSLLFMGLLAYVLGFFKEEIRQRLKFSELEYRTLFEESPVGLIKTGFSGNILDVNNEMVYMLGAESRKEVLEYSLEELLQLPIDRKEFRRKLINGGNISGEYNFKSFWDEEIWLSYNARPVRGTDGGISEIIISCEDITGRKLAEEKIKKLTFRDSLTGLYNRMYFQEEMARLDTERQLPLAIIMGDVNGLKLTNDAFGHQQGDELLKKVARAVENCCRQEDLVARWGGDEYVLLLPETGGPEARIICQRIEKKVRELDADPIQPSISLGYAVKKEKDVEIENVFRKAENWMYKRKLQESRNTQGTIIKSLKETLYSSTHETREHCERMSEMALKIGEKLGLSRDKMIDLELLAEFHDIGKASVSSSLLLKESELSPEEWEEVQRHAETGYQIASSSYELNSIAEGILGHHEWWDGSGYPQGLAGKEIPVEARIIAVVDAYDVMTQRTSYSDKLSYEEALVELKEGAGSQFDPEIVDVFIYEVLEKSRLLSS